MPCTNVQSEIVRAAWYHDVPACVRARGAQRDGPQRALPRHRAERPHADAQRPRRAQAPVHHRVPGARRRAHPRKAASPSRGRAAPAMAADARCEPRVARALSPRPATRRLSKRRQTDLLSRHLPRTTRRLSKRARAACRAHARRASRARTPVNGALHRLCRLDQGHRRVRLRLRARQPPRKGAPALPRPPVHRLFVGRSRRLV